jgi:hypothetical protein
MRNKTTLPVIKGDRGFDADSGPPVMPEGAQIQFFTTGAMGGDAGHGGNATIRFIVENSGAYELQVNGKNINLEVGNRALIVDFIACGDWELDALRESLVTVAEQVAIYDRAVREWREEQKRSIASEGV